MKNYTIPLKLLISEYISAELQYLNFQLSTGKAKYTIDLNSDCIKNNMILAHCNGNIYQFSYDTKIQYIGRYMRFIWDFWKFNGKTIFEDWIQSKNGQQLNQCVRDSCTYNTNDNRCIKNLQNNCSYKLLR